MERFAIVAALVAALTLAGCAPHAAVKPANTIILSVDASGKGADDRDMQKVLDALKMIEAGRIQLAIDGPLTEVVSKYETMYAGKPGKVFCARGLVDALAYAGMGAKAVNGKADVPVQVTARPGRRRTGRAATPTAKWPAMPMRGPSWRRPWRCRRWTAKRTRIHL